MNSKPTKADPSYIAAAAVELAGCGTSRQLQDWGRTWATKTDDCDEYTQRALDRAAIEAEPRPGYSVLDRRRLAAKFLAEGLKGWL